MVLQGLRHSANAWPVRIQEMEKVIKRVLILARFFLKERW